MVTQNLKVFAILLLVGCCSALRLPGGPLQIPLLGSVGFLAKLYLKKESLPEVLKYYSARYGDIVRIRTGPIQQYWVSDVESELTAEILNALDASGRSQLKEPAFGEEFLFLTRSVDRARKIRKKQREWVRKRGSPLRISAAVGAAFPALSTELQLLPTLPAQWKQDAVCRHSVRALLGTLIGGPRSSQRSLAGTPMEDCKEGWLTDPELDRLTEATANYRRRGPRGRLLASKESYAEIVSSILRKAIARSAEIDNSMKIAQERIDTLPILVSAIVGGSEIYPLLLHWAMRHLAVSPGLQRALREDCRAHTNTTGLGGEALLYGPLMQRFVGYVAWAHPYSAAIGPPRKLTADIVVDANTADAGLPERREAVTLCKEAILFIMHPGLWLDWNSKFLQSANQTVTRDLTIMEACQLRQSTQEATKEVEQCKSTSWPMFGMGERTCIAPEMSVSFLGSVLCAVLSRYEVRVRAEDQQRTVRELFAYEEDGSLLVPQHTDIGLELQPI